MADITRRKIMTACVLAPIGLAVGNKLAMAAGLVDAISSRSAPASSAARRFPNVEVITHEGKKVRFYDDLIKDKIVMITFFYARCEKFCPPQTANLVKVQKMLGDRVGRDIFMYSLTLKPQEDTPEMLHHYVHMNGIGPGWQLLTGTPKDMEELRVKLGFRDSDPVLDADTTNHIGLVLFGNDKLNRWSGCPSLTPPEEIVRELSWLDAVIPDNGQRG